MDNKETTIDGIIEWLQRRIEARDVIDAHTWLRAAQSLNVLLTAEQNLLYELQQNVANEKCLYIEQGDTVAKANLKSSASDIYKVMLQQKGKITRVEEMIKLSKIHARLADNEYRAQQ